MKITNEYTWSDDTFKEDFESFDCDIDDPNAGERARLFYWMHDYIDDHFFEWSCELLKEMRKDNADEIERNPNSFVYLGYVFTPYKQLKGAASTFDYISKHIEIDYLSGIMEDEWNYEDFYAASTDKECDLFRCDGMLWIPGNARLFKWTDKE